jgi:uncharacterized protein (DUF2141 family)
MPKKEGQVMARRIAFWAVIFLTSLLRAAEITLQIEGLEILKQEGSIVAHLFNNADDFPSEKTYKAVSADLGRGSNIKFTDLGEGDYALFVFHDENNNGKLDTNFIGIPREPVVVSNGAKGVMGPPKFKDASFSLKKGESKIVKFVFVRK